MSTLAFGIWDAFGAYEVASFPVHARFMSSTSVRSS